jgi:hypothetical protein
MPDKKPLSKAKARNAIKKVKKSTATAKKNLPTRPLRPREGNQNARKWDNDRLEDLAKRMLESAEKPDCWSLCQVANEVDILPNYLLELAKSYELVSVAYSKVKGILSARYSALAASGGGHGVFVMKMIPYYNKQFYDFDLALLKDQEDTKANVRIREKRELGEKIDDGNGNVLDEFDEFLQWKAARKAKKDL